MSDAYADLAEMLTLFPRRSVLPPLPSGTSGDIVELGSGAGHHTVELARRFPQAHVWAVESSQSMRTLLHATAAAHPELHDRITVEPRDLFEASLPDQWALTVGVHFLCQLDSGDRDRLWALLADRMSPNGVAVFDPHVSPELREVPRKRTVNQRLGHNHYEAWFEQSILDTRTVRTVNEFRVLRGGAVLHSRADVAEFTITDSTELADEITGHGLDAVFDDESVIVRRS